MATVRIEYTFADGDSLASEVRVSTSYPDGLNQAVKEALNAFGTALQFSQQTLTEGDDEWPLSTAVGGRSTTARLGTITSCRCWLRTATNRRR